MGGCDELYHVPLIAKIDGNFTNPVFTQKGPLKGRTKVAGPKSIKLTLVQTMVYTFTAMEMVSW